MNRIRRVGNTYQCLVTPSRAYDVGFEFLTGSWTDESLMGFDVLECRTYNEAECEAIEHPDIDWVKLVEFHKEPFFFLRDHIKSLLDTVKVVIEFKPVLMHPQQVKTTMFNRVLKGKRDMIDKNSTTGFRTVDDMNDIINFTIINPWTKNLSEIEKRLMRSDRLRIFNRIEKNGIIHLIGRTDLDTTFEIILTTSIMDNWMEWRRVNIDKPIELHMSTLKNCLKTQRLIDATPVLR
jgi:hypothetical protein